MINKNISIWRGSATPPTNYHLWEKEDGGLYVYLDEKWQHLVTPADKIILDKHLQQLDKIKNLALTEIDPIDTNTYKSYLLKSDDNIFGTTINIPKDRFIKLVTLGYDNATIDESTGIITIGTGLSKEYLLFSVALESGSYELVSINLTNFLTEKDYSDGLEVVDNKLKVKVDPSSEEYFKVTNNGIKVEGINANFNKINERLATISNTQIKRSEMGVANGVATLDNNSTIPYNLLPAIADDEDLIGVNNRLKLKDRVYNPDNFSGKGYVILRKNIISGKNILTRDMINKSNTIYEIRYDFDLNAESINLPENCILKIVGGSFYNGTLTGQKTIINAKNTVIFKNIIILGTWVVTDIYQSWFDFDLNELADNRNNFKNIIQLTNADITNNVYFNDGIYYTKVYDKEDLTEEALFLLNSNTNLYLNNCIIKTIPFKYTHKNIIIVKNANNINIYGGILVGDADTHDYDTTISGTHEFSHGIKICTNSRNININNTIIEKFTGDGIDLVESGENAINNVQITNVVCDSNNRQGISIESGKNIFIKDSKFINTSSIHVTAPSAGLDIEPWTKGVYVENIHIENCVLKNNKGGIIIQPNVLEDDKVYNENNISINKSIVDSSIVIYYCNTIKINEIKNATYIKLTQTKNIDINNVNVDILETYQSLENLSLTKCCIAQRMLITENSNNDNVKITDCDINVLNIELLKNIKINNSIINSFEQYRTTLYTFIKDSKIKAFKLLSGTVELLNNDIQFENKNALFLTGKIVGNVISRNTNNAIQIGNAVIKQNLIINKNEKETLFTLKQKDGIYEFIDNQIQGFKYLCSLDLVPKKVKIYLNSPIILCRNYINPSTIEVIDGCLDIKDGITRIYREGNWYSLNLTNPNAVERPTDKFSGQSFFDKSLNYPIWWNGDKWIDSNGHEAYANKGTSSNRPILLTEDVGFQYYDTTLKKYIVWNGTEWTNIDSTNLDTPTDEWITIE